MKWPVTCYIIILDAFHLFLHILFGAGSWPGNLTIVIKMTNNVLWPSSSVPGIYRTGTLTDSSVCVCKGSPAVSFVIAKKKKALETARCQAVGIASENHEQFTVEHSAVGKRMRRPGLRPPESLSCVAKWKNEDRIFAFAFICVNISKYTQGISNSSCSRKENSVARRETYPLIFFFILNHGNVQTSKIFHIINMF